jgi:hypothetical protein
MRKNRKWLRGPLQGLALLLGLAPPLLAQDPQPRVSLSGFGTLGVGISDSHLVGFMREGTQAPNGILDHPNASVDSRLGLQLQGHLADGLDATVQGVSKYRYDGTFKPQLTLAFLNWNPAGSLELRAGRIAIEQVLGAASLDVGYSYLWVRPSVEFFGLRTLPTLDGGDLSYSFALPSGTNLKATAFAGSIVAKAPVQGGAPYDFTGSPASGALLLVQHGPWEVRLSHSRTRLKNEFGSPIADLRNFLAGASVILQDPRPGQAAEALLVKDARVHFSTAELSYMEGPLEFRGTFCRVDADRLLVPPAKIGYASLAYHLGAFVPYGLFSGGISKPSATPDAGAAPLLPVPGANTVPAGLQILVDHAHLDQRT